MGKDKELAVILAVFLSFWTWAYSYNRDGTKFWIGLIVSFIGIFMLMLPTLAIWIWAIIDRASLDRKEYKNIK